MKKYLYLTKQAWVEPWVRGGSVPIFPASTYRAAFRSGTQTPDENTIHRSPVDIRDLGKLGFGFAEIQNLTMTGCQSNGVVIPSFSGSFYTEDGLILSLCNKKSNDICKRLGKRACVEIHDVDALKAVLDSQIGVVGTARDCEYTTDHQRDHFLKGLEDSWQCEYRMFWPRTEKINVLLPSGVARTIKMKV